jgi:hypothetical protein
VAVEVRAVTEGKITCVVASVGDGDGRVGLVAGIRLIGAVAQAVSRVNTAIRKINLGFIDYP